MKKLSRTVFLTLFGILSLFLIISLILLNVQSYRREYENLSRNLEMVDERGNRIRMEMQGGGKQGAIKDDGMPPGQMPEDYQGQGDYQNKEDYQGQGEIQNKEDYQGQGEFQNKSEIENMMVMDHEVYTVELSGNSIERIINHGNMSSDFDAQAAAEEIISSNEGDTLKVGNLYRNGYSFSYRTGRSIIIINKESVSQKMRSLLFESLLIFLVLEIVITFVSKLITKWITKPAREAFDKQREFIADASHELKTPLAVIIASSDELTVDESNGKYIENIKYESDRMSKLISGLLDLSRIEEGISRDSFKDENLSGIVEKTCLVFEGVAFEQGVGIETEIEDGITYKCSKEEIEKLVSTLLDNAVKHSYKDTSVLVRLYRSRNSIIFKVINTGDPIKDGDEEKIFERFYRADKSRSRKENRYGLGLAIAKSIVLNHNGSIKAGSEDGKTTFRVEL